MQMNRRIVFLAAAIVVLLLLLLLLMTCRRRSICSNFDNGDEGWRVTGDVQNESAKPDFIDREGNPGGCLSATDQAAGGVWYWNAPGKFLGSKAWMMGGELSYDLKQSETDSQFEAADVILEGKGMSLVYVFPGRPGREWTSFKVVLSAGEGWKKNGINGGDAGEEDFRKVLSALEGLKIRGEYRTGPDKGGIDNVCMGRR